MSDYIKNIDEWLDDSIDECLDALKAKQKSRIWFDPDVELLNSICRAIQELEDLREDLFLNRKYA